MRIQDTGIVIGLKRYGENKWIAHLLTHAHGRVSGLVHSRRKNPIDIGYLCAIQWSSRSEHGLGTLTHECMSAISPALRGHYPRLLALQSMTELLTHALMERHPYPKLYTCVAHTRHMLSIMHTHDWRDAYLAFECTLLRELGFALSLDHCVTTGTDVDLAYISPKTGYAVSATVGAAYAPYLLPYPERLRAAPSLSASYRQALHVLGFFIEKNIYTQDPYHALQQFHVRESGKMPHQSPHFKKNFLLTRELLCNLIDHGVLSPHDSTKAA